MSDAKPEPQDEYPALNSPNAYVSVYRGSIVLRFGPFPRAKAAAIIGQCLNEGIPATLVWICDGEFDWETARALRGYPEPKDEAVS